MSDKYFRAERTRRSDLELKVEILKAISEGATKQTHVIQRSNISWSMAQSFIRRLETQGLVEAKRTKGRKFLSITDRGKRVLNSYTSMVKEFALELPTQQQDANSTQQEETAKVLLP